MQHATISIRTNEPDFSAIPDPNYVRSNSVYSNVKEILPKDAQIPLGKYITLSHYVAANLMDDMITGRSVTSILNLIK